jgi:hypothetical protein
MVTVEQYAEELVRLVRIDREREPERFGSVNSWEELHGVCDANEYLIEADEKFGFDYTGSDDQNEFANAAISAAVTKLGWEDA